MRLALSTLTLIGIAAAPCAAQAVSSSESRGKLAIPSVPDASGWQAVISFDSAATR